MRKWNILFLVFLFLLFTIQFSSSSLSIRASDDLDTTQVLRSYTASEGISSFAVANDKLYIGCQYLLNGCTAYHVLCFNAENGAYLWSYNTSGGIAFITIADDKAYIGFNENYEPFFGRVQCINALTGTSIWNYSMGEVYFSQVVDGKIYIENGEFYCLNASTGELVWKNNDYSENNLVFAYGKGYFKSYYGEGKIEVYCVNPENWSKIWSCHPANKPVEPSPAACDEEVYICSSADGVFCLNAENGTVIWRLKTSAIYSSPVVANGKVYIGSDEDGKVFCLNAENGVPIWNYTTGNMRTFSPAVDYERVYFISMVPVSGTQVDAWIYCLNATTGAYIWKYTSEYVSSAPVISNGAVYLIAEDSETIIALNATYTPMNTSSPSPTVVPSPSPNSVFTPNPSPSGPDFPSWIILSIVMVATLLSIVFIKRRLTKK